MDLTYFLLTIPQWIIFVSIVVIVYGWIENKKIFWQIGCLSLVILGGFALYAILSRLVTPDLYVVEDELPMDDIDSSGLPGEMFMIPIYWGLVFNGFLGLVTLLLFKTKWYKWMTVITMLVSLGIFFMLFEALKT